MKEASKRNYFVFCLVVIFGLIAAFFMSRFSICLGNVIDVVINPNDSLVHSIEMCVFMLLCWLVVSFLYDYTEIIYVNRVVRFIKRKLYTAMFNKELSEFFDEKNGYYLSVFSKDIDLLVDNYLIPKCDMICNMLSACVCMLSIFLINWKLGVSYVFISLMTVVLSQLPGALMAKETTEYTSANSNYLNSLENVLSGFEQIKLLSIGKVFLDKLDEEDGKYEKTRKSYLFAKIAAGDLGKSFGMLAQLLCMAVGIWLAIKGSITVGMMIAAVQLLNGVFSPLQLFVQDKNLIGTAKDIIDRIEEKQYIEECTYDRMEEVIHDITFENIHLEFGNKKIFDDYSISFSAGKKYAIVGESGIGKSTLVKLLMKYVLTDKYDGKIRVNSRDISTVSTRDIYKKIGFVQRNSFLVDGTVKDNIILYRDDLVDEIVCNVCKSLSLSENLVNKSIDISNPGGLSFGEKQRIDIARFLVNDYDVLIFDEPTSNLDPRTASEIYDRILGIENKIIIVITHDYSKELLDRFDEVVAMG